MILKEVRWEKETWKIGTVYARENIRKLLEKR